MKKIKFLNIGVLSVLALVILSLSSCLKDPRAIDYADSPPLVEFPLAGSNANRSVLIGPTFPYVAKASDGTYKLVVAVNLASPSLLSQDVSFTVAIDNSTLTGTASTTKPTTAQLTPAGSQTSGALTAIAPLPAADYSVQGSLSGTIPAGQRLAYVTVNVNGTLVGNSIKNYGLRFTLTQASQQISSYNAMVYVFQFQ